MTTNESGLIKSSNWSTPICCHLEHNPPSMIVIPEGHIYRHVCPGCKSEVLLKPTETYLMKRNGTYF